MNSIVLTKALYAPPRKIKNIRGKQKNGFHFLAEKLIKENINFRQENRAVRDDIRDLQNEKRSVEDENRAVKDENRALKDENRALHEELGRMQHYR